MSRRHTSKRKRIGRGAGAADSRRWCEEAYKKRYPDKRAAERAKHYIQSNYRDSDRSIPVRTYECDQCRGWHLTSWEEPNGPQASV